MVNAGSGMGKRKGKRRKLNKVLQNLRKKIGKIYRKNVIAKRESRKQDNNFRGRNSFYFCYFLIKYPESIVSI